MIRWTDQHAHLDPETADEALAECREAGVLRLIDVGTDVESSERAITMARRFPEVWATAGVHPHDASGGIDGLEALLGRERVVGVGECGLDYHYDHSPRDAQRTVFADQIALAHQHDLALVIHTREAWDDTFDILRAEGVPERTVMHCFTGGPDEARRCLDLGAHLSFSGIVTFPSAPELREAAVLCPADRLLVETDAPYLAPVPHRGKRNRPALVAVVGASVAEVRGDEVADVAAATWCNASVLYRLPPDDPPST
jgi:TatD DNase family protein